MNSIHTKKWRLAELGGDEKRYIDRINLIHNLGGRFNCLREHQFIFDDEFLVLNSEYVKPSKELNYSSTLDALKVLALELESINSLMLHHGDIVARNTIWDGHRFVLVDWEPLLEYGTKPNTFLKSTKPYISKLDKENFKITSNTDKIGFYYFSKKKLFGWFPTNPLEVLKLEEYLISQSFVDLIELVCNGLG